MKGRRVLVTRPQPGADRTAARLLELGYQPVTLPLTRIVPLPQTPPGFIPDLVVATSPQAFVHLTSGLAGMLANIPVTVTGDGTAAAAKSAGFAQVDPSGGNVANLVAALAGRGIGNVSVLYLAGRVRRPDLETFLENHARSTATLEVYDTISVSYTTEKLQEICGDTPLGFVLLTSVETVNALALIPGMEFRYHIDKSVFICLSQRIAEAAGKVFANPVFVCAQPTEDSLMECLAEANRNS